MFNHIIVRKPGCSVVDGLTTAKLGRPIYAKAMAQHAEYVKAMESCGVLVKALDADEAYPDSCFVEDTAVVCEKLAVITNPGAPSRKGETRAVRRALDEFYTDFEFIREPGTLEGGDVMQVGNHFYIGISTRTNEAGARQFIDILKNYGFSGSIIHLKKLFHLKTGVSFIGDHTLLVAGELIDHPDFAEFGKIIIDEDEMYAANVIEMNGHLVIPAGFPKAEAKLLAAGYATKAVDLSEFQKIDGGLTCLSLRF
ncbi:MAG: N(G),N(G)-dimethylarginine dimethylaminohydrolase [Dethiobacter sp.]|jgi:dimethylargininase|nr:N(G),N(G)-dimethylarginine dimethylaminohydrolase [Dethiobacter sp.]